jgi:hypothetical protein
MSIGWLLDSPAGDPTGMAGSVPIRTMKRKTWIQLMLGSVTRRLAAGGRQPSWQ